MKKLYVGDIIIETDGKGSGNLVSLLERYDDPEYNAAMNAIEYIVLAHACAGVDVESPAYRKGIEVGLEAIVNYY